MTVSSMNTSMPIETARCWRARIISRPVRSPDVGQAGVAVAAEVALADLARRGAVEKGTPLLELVHALGGFLGVQFRHPPVVEELAAAHRVAEMDLPVVLGPQVAQGGGDAAFGHDRVGLAEEAAAYEGGAGARLVGGHGGPQAGATGADHDDVIRMVLERFFRGHLEKPRVVYPAARHQPDIKVGQGHEDQAHPGDLHVPGVELGHEAP